MPEDMGVVVRLPRQVYQYLVDRAILETYDPEDSTPREDREPDVAVWSAIVGLIDIAEGTSFSAMKDHREEGFRDIRRSWADDWGWPPLYIHETILSLLHEDHGA